MEEDDDEGMLRDEAKGAVLEVEEVDVEVRAEGEDEGIKYESPASTKEGSLYS
jgi:hypothetical protein